MELEFSGVVFEWRGPAPHHFVRVPEAEAELIADTAQAVTYGWGMVPVRGWLGESEFTTSLWPQDGGYVVPLKAAVRRAEGVELDDEVVVRLRIHV
ncbi:MAG: hypothetical protein CMH83_02990 [Nocardioides sp.]|nr:hypothetical protein [Nocardioides sp.]